MLRRQDVVGAGGVVLSLACLSACSGSSAGSAATSTTSQSGARVTVTGSAASVPGSAAVGVTEVAISVRNGKVSPAFHRVQISLGRRVRLLVTSDVDDEVHVHGYEIEEKLEAGRPTTVDLTADQPGGFTVEAHSTDLGLVPLEVR